MAILRIARMGHPILRGKAATVEDPTGSLGVRPGHAPLVTPLVRGILTARAPGGHERYLALDGGVLLVSGDVVEVVSRQAVESDDLDHLEQNVVSKFVGQAEQDQTNFVAFEKMRLAFMRRLLDLEKGE